LTVSTTNRKAGPFSGNDATTVFPFAFRVFTDTDLLVVVALAGVETALVLDVDFTASLNASQDNNPGGQITLTTALATGKTLVITSDIPATQLTLITNGGGFFPAVFNAVFDKAVVLIQQLAEQMGRGFRIPLTATGVTSFDVPVSAGAVLQWAPDGSALLAQSLPDLSLSLALPDTAGQGGKYLTNNGAGVSSWAAAPVLSVAGQTGAVAAAAAAAVRAGTTKAQVMTPGDTYDGLVEVALTDAATVAVDMGAGINFTLTLGGNRTRGNPTNQKPGQEGHIRVTQDATGSRTLAFASNWKRTGGAPTMTTTATATDVLIYKVLANGYILYDIKRNPS